MRFFTFFLWALGAFTQLTYQPMHAQNASLLYVSDQEVAIGGYDVTTYFTQHEAVRGAKAFSTQHNGATYYFTSDANRSLFLANPTQYLPEFGGYCAFAMGAKGAAVPSNPATFKLHDGKLYLFFNDYYEGNPFNTIVPWNGDEANMLTQAETNWKTMADK